MRRAAMLALIAVASCKGTQSPDGAPGLDVVIHHAAYDDHSDTPNAIKAKCEFHQVVAEAVSAATPGSSVSTGSSPLVLSMVIVTMRGVEAAWEGDSSVIVRGELRDGGTLTGSFRIKYSAAAGLMGGKAGRCKALETIADYMAEDIGPWLQSPEIDSKLGE